MWSSMVQLILLDRTQPMWLDMTMASYKYNLVHVIMYDSIIFDQGWPNSYS